MKRMLLSLSVFGLLAGGPALAKDDFWKTEQIGGLKLNLPAAQVRVPAECRQPQKTAEQYWGADGEYHQSWKYPTCGLEIGLVAEKAKGPQTVESVTLQAPSKLRTGRGIAIGSTMQDVLKAYAQDISSPEHDPNGTLMVGSGYPGLYVKLKAGKVIGLYFGPGAE